MDYKAIVLIPQRPHHPLVLAPLPAGEEELEEGGVKVRMEEGGVEEGGVEKWRREGWGKEEVGREEGERERKKGE